MASAACDDAATEMLAQQRQAFAVLQDKYAHARCMAYCPAMDLVAVLTVDDQVIVHRTISWQRLLHIKPSDVSFEVTTLAWSPDGLYLALGCHGGEVVVYDIETGEQRTELRALKQLHELQHQHAITAMHWTAICEPNDRDACVLNDQLPHGSAAHLSDRAARLLPHETTSSNTAMDSETSVLVTADTSGAVVLWWRGCVYLTKVLVPALVAAAQAHELSGAIAQTTSIATRIERVQLAPDLSRLFVVLTDAHDVSTVATPSSSPQPLDHKRQHRLVALDLGALQHAQLEIAFVTRVVAQSHVALNALVLAVRQVATGWKTATRVFELKLSLLSSLYDKYACDDPPQVDMLAVVASGITAPALAQYFAQDIQELSIDRMEKALQSGCDNITTLLEATIKPALVALLFHLTELRGRAKWRSTTFATTLGITIAQLDDLVAAVQLVHVSIETLSHAVHETREDLLLLLAWFRSRIRVHTNASLSGGPSTNLAGRIGRDATTSLLNQRRLCGFLQRAVVAALVHRDAQPAHSKGRVETTFGNLVAQHLARSTPVSDSINSSSSDTNAMDARPPSVSSLDALEALEHKWFAMLACLTQRVAQTIAVDASECVDLGSSVDELALHFRVERDSSSSMADSDDANDDESDDDDELVDWQSLTSFSQAQRATTPSPQLMVGARVSQHELLLLRATWCANDALVWHAAKIAVASRSDGSAAELRGFDFYGDSSLRRTEQLAYLMTDVSDQDDALPQDSSDATRRGPMDADESDSLYLQPYDQLRFTLLTRINALHELQVRTAELDALPKLPLPMLHGSCRVRRLATSATATATSTLLRRVLANAKRGVICTLSLTNRLTIFDAEDDDDDGDDDDGAVDSQDIDLQ